MVDAQTEETPDFSLRLGERGDLLAVKTSEIARQVTAGGPVDERELQEAREVLEQVDTMLTLVEEGAVTPNGDARASAD